MAGRLRPVHHVPKGLEVIRAAVLVFEVIGVLPYVATEDRPAFATRDRLAHDRIVLVGGGDDLEFAAVPHEPDPAAAKPAQAAGFKLFLESVEATERSLQVVCESTALTDALKCIQLS